ncbi:unnamed protein product, partial [Rotaria sordida]
MKVEASTRSNDRQEKAKQPLYSEQFMISSIDNDNKPIDVPCPSPIPNACEPLASQGLAIINDTAQDKTERRTGFNGDAKLALEYGADGIVVCNHHGRQVDSGLSAIECLKDIVGFVNGRCEVFVDSGIRTGTDVLKCLALGAKGVLVGRPILYG